MRIRTRILIALCFLLAFALVPSPDADRGLPFLGYLQVREWLLGSGSPLEAWHAHGRDVELDVELRQSPPLVHEQEREQRLDEYRKLGHEWTLAHPLADRDQRPESPVARLLLTVYVGSDGVQARLPRPDGTEARFERTFPSRASLLPAVVTIVLAVLTQRVLFGLLCGGLAGAFALVAGSGGAAADAGLAAQAGGAVEHLFVDALWRRSVLEDFYLQITLFVVFLFMTVGVITRNGGVHGLVTRLQRFVRGPRSAQAVTVGAGMSVFFDDYTNCLLVGTTMRPLCDRLRVAREKLAYLVDSTAAPIAGLSVFSTWVVYEMSQYRAPLALVTRPDGTPYVADDAFSVFLSSLPFRFYSWFALALVVLVVLLRRDFGPMLRAERRARRGELLAPGAVPMAALDRHTAEPHEGIPHRARNAVVPLVVLVAGTVGLMLWQGISQVRQVPELASLPLGAWLREVLARAQSTTALLYASAIAWLVAVALTLAQRLLSPRQILATSLRSTRALYLAFGILFLAWSLGHICKDLGTSLYLTAGARDAMTAGALPILLFVVAGAMAFSTGTSFGTMAILLPNVVVLAHRLGTEAAFGGDPATGGTALMLISIGAVLEGAIFGDHCSPISDTTVLSSLGAQCDLLGHVTTQLPYATLAMAAAALCGYLPIVWFGPELWPICMLAGVAVMALFLLLRGRDPDRPTPSTHAASYRTAGPA